MFNFSANHLFLLSRKGYRSCAVLLLRVTWVLVISERGVVFVNDPDRDRLNLATLTKGDMAAYGQAELHADLRTPLPSDEWVSASLLLQ